MTSRYHPHTRAVLDRCAALGNRIREIRNRTDKTTDIQPWDRDNVAYVAACSLQDRWSTVLTELRKLDPTPPCMTCQEYPCNCPTPTTLIL